MAIKCPRCGEEAENDRYYCSSCGQELQPTDLSDEERNAPARMVRDIDGRALTIFLEGVALSIIGLIVYSFGVYFGISSGADAVLGWPGMVMTIGFCMIGISVFMNWSQGLPRSVRLAIGSEIVFGIISLTVCFAMIMQVTSWESVAKTTGGQLSKIPVYGYRPLTICLFIPLVWCPFLVVWGLWVANRLAWPAAVMLSLVNIPLIVSGLPSHNDAKALMVGIQVVFLVILMTKIVRSFYSKSAMQRLTTAAP